MITVHEQGQIDEFYNNNEELYNLIERSIKEDLGDEVRDAINILEEALET